MKKLVAMALMGTMLFSNVLGVNATGLRDVFDAKYYADQYGDLKDAFGYDEEKLWEHYQTYGLNEGRNMSPILDVVKYRETYKDLDDAFGDNWDAYVEHYINYGAREDRDSGTDFDLATYLSAYTDLKQAFGDDLLAAAKHYLEFGQEEKRELISKEAYAAYINPVPQKAPAQNPTVGEVPLVQVTGEVESEAYAKVKGAFEDIVLKMRADGIVKADDVCVAMDESSLKVDINFADKDADIVLQKDARENTYVLTMDSDFVWLKGLAATINGKDSASYNKELFLATLGLVSEEPQSLFDRIDADYFSPAGVSDVEWEKVGNCYIMGGEIVYKDYISYIITTDGSTGYYHHDASYLFQVTDANQNTAECRVAYDSSVVTYTLGEDNKVYFSGKNLDPEYGIPYPVCDYVRLVTGCSSYEEYKASLQAQLEAAGDEDAYIWSYDECTINGYTYYLFEVFYETENAKGDPDMLYVQVGDNEYIEIYNLFPFTSLEDFVKTAFFIK